MFRLTLAAALLLVQPRCIAAEPLLDRLLIVAPAAPGGGWDQTARAMQHALLAEGLVRVVEVQNVAGAAGTIGLAQFIDTHRGDGRALLVSGLVMLGATLWNDSPVSLGQVTPTARLTGEYEVIAVPANSPHRHMQSLLEALRAKPGAVSWGGGSAGGTDHILAGLIAAAAGVDPRRVNYIAFSGGGEAVAALLGGNVTAGVSGYSEFGPHIESGRLRAIGISAPQRIAGITAPTLRDQGIDVELSNWRAVVGAPDMSRDDQRRIADVVRRMVRSATWRTTLADRAWTDVYLEGDDFARYLESERVRIARIVTRLRGPASGEPVRVGQRIFPIVIVAGAMIISVLFVRRFFTSRLANLQASPHLRTGNRRAVARMACGLIAFVALLDLAGFVVAATVLFAVVANALGPSQAGPYMTEEAGPSIRVDAGPHVKEDAGPDVRGKAGPYEGMRRGVAAVLFAALVYVAFTRGLDLALPAGTLWAWMR